MRVREWIRHTSIEAEIHDYAGLPNNTPRDVARNLPTVVAAEARTRRLVRRTFDRVLIHREVTPFSSGGAIERIARNSQLSVYDFDDALMWSPSTRRDGLWSKADSCLRAVESVDRVIAGSEVLAEWAQGHNSDVRLIPTCVHPDDYDAKTSFAMNAKPRIVWLGSPSTEGYLQSIAPVLMEAHRLTDCRLTVISAGNASLGELSSMSERVDWRQGTERTLSSYDLAVAPLVDGPWERGKCAYKLLQYGAAGLPTVVTPVGANRQAADKLGLIAASNSREWRDALLDLLRAPEGVREAMGREARLGVLQYYSFSRWAPEWLDAVGEAKQPCQMPTTDGGN